MSSPVDPEDAAVVREAAAEAIRKAAASEVQTVVDGLRDQLDNPQK